MTLSADEIVLALLVLIAAALYASVGQAGATGYLAAMGLMGVDHTVMKPVALALNVLVAGIGTVQFWRAGRLSLRTFYPLAVLGFPFSLVGGSIDLPGHLYYPVIGLILLLAAAQLVRSTLGPISPSDATPRQPPFLPAMLTGAVIGFVSGVTGTGGGIFLAPVILAMGWVEIRRAAAVSAAYNLLNSAAALAGAYGSLGALPPALPLWLVAAAGGGLLGSILGSRYLPEQALRFVLAAVLLVSGIKLLVF